MTPSMHMGTVRAAGWRLVELLAVSATIVVIAASAARASTRPASVARAPFPVLAGTAVLRQAPPAIPGPTRARGATLAGVVVAAAARAHPGSGRRVWQVATQTGWSREPMVLLVLGSAIHNGRQWLHVLLPIRPAHSTGWIPRDNTTLLHTRYWITVDTRARTVTVARSGHVVHRYRAVVGKPSTPTPTGLAAIYEKDPQPDPTGFLGPWALPLTALSNALRTFEGGPGRVAIHGRDATSLLDPLGTARSHGCIRIDNQPVNWLAHHVSQGTPVQIIG
jgi:lipoprotein-anchoring transpeptidase ErfK/SrfK